jgi:hypothetical protein
MGKKIDYILGRFIPDLLKLSSVAEPYHFDAAPDPAPSTNLSVQYASYAE